MALPQRRLRVFVSSAGSLVDERGTAREAIVGLRLDPVMFEDWGARDVPMREAYLREVRSSDLYVGLFGGDWSDPTNEEFVEASTTRRPRLVYIRQLSRGTRDPRLLEFLQKISNPQEGLVYKKFDTLPQLKEQIQNDLIDHMCEMTLRAAQTGLPRQAPEVVAVQVPMPQLKKFETEVNPGEAGAGDELSLHIVFSATLTNGLLSAHIAHEEARVQFWAPNRDTWNPYLDTGLLNGSFERARFRWTVEIPPWMPPGTLIVSPGIWEDPLGVPSGRRQLAVGSHKVRLTETRDERVLSLRQFYKRIQGREPDALGLKYWFDSLVTQKLSMGRILVDGFLKSVEYRVEKLHQIFQVQAPIEDRARWVHGIQGGLAGMADLIKHLYSINVDVGTLPSDKTLALNELATRLGVRLTEDRIQRIIEASAAAGEDPLAFGLLRLLNDDEFIMAQILSLRDPHQRKPEPKRIREAQSALERTQDRAEFFWNLWRQGWPPEAS